MEHWAASLLNKLLPLLTGPALLGAGVLHCLIGLLATAIAHRKGYPLHRWLLWGLIGGTPSLLVALWLPPHAADLS